eukprot:TRINITY_DN4581_c0_g2_i1.p1 TRINITY_DN4581_c0_g2~~TRINITY_DN4581_c0_g2_i1.p1  ORF type:complete len:218 (+),score=17.52 TRINITY_DN4581_c0_g2_i1:1580-2233(+)
MLALLAFCSSWCCLALVHAFAPARRKVRRGWTRMRRGPARLRWGPLHLQIRYLAPVLESIWKLTHTMPYTKTRSPVRQEMNLSCAFGLMMSPSILRAAPSKHHTMQTSKCHRTPKARAQTFAAAPQVDGSEKPWRNLLAKIINPHQAPQPQYGQTKVLQRGHNQNGSSYYPQQHAAAAPTVSRNTGQASQHWQGRPNAKKEQVNKWADSNRLFEKLR